MLPSFGSPKHSVCLCNIAVAQLNLHLSLLPGAEVCDEEATGEIIVSDNRTPCGKLKCLTHSCDPCGCFPAASKLFKNLGYSQLEGRKCNCVSPNRKEIRHK